MTFNGLLTAVLPSQGAAMHLARTRLIRADSFSLRKSFAIRRPREIWTKGIAKRGEIALSGQ